MPMEAKLTEINPYEVLRYLGYHGGEIPEETMADIDRCARQIMEAATPRLLCRTFDLEDMTPVGTSLRLEGEDIKAQLSGCHKVILLAATLGGGVETLTRRAQVGNLSDAVILDSCASSAIENVCDHAEAELRRAWEGYYLTDRFSPGYGDLPIGLQSQFCAVLDTQRRMGLCVSQSGIMIPRKSVTAVMGISNTPVKRRPRGCAVCNLRETCAFRRRGKTCGK